MPRRVQKDTILVTAAELFAGRDFHAVQMDDVAAATGVAKGTLYNHFGSKEKLYAAILHQRLSNLTSLLEETCTADGDVWAAVDAFVVHWERFMTDHPHFFLLLRKSDHVAASLEDGDGRQFPERIRGLLRDLLQQGIAQNRFRAMDVEVACDAILGMAEGCLRGRIGKKKSKGGAACIMDLLRHGIAAE